jgi:glycosyltransferase involved in cell wall biosynthesis
MHVLFLSDNFPPETNAPATRLHEHARRWVRAGHRVTVVTCAPNFPRGEVFEGYRNRWLSRETIDGIEVWRVKTFIAANSGFLLRTLDFLSFMVMGVLGGLLPRRPDLVVASSPQFFAAVGGWALSALRRRPFVFEVRDLWPASIAAVGAMRQSPLLRLLERVELFLYRRATRIVTVTHAFRDDLVARGVPAEKIDVVTNGVDLDRYAPTERDAGVAREFGVEECFVVGYLGTHGMAHALENVLDAAERLRDLDEVRFLFVGSGAAKAYLVAEAHRRGLTNVVFRDPQPKERMPELWGLCDVALVHLKDMPVFETVIPSKIFEGMGMARPVLLAGPDGEAAGIVRDTGCGLWVPPEDPEALAHAVRRLATDGELRRRLAAASLAAAPAYSRDTLAARMLASLEAARTGDRPCETAATDEGAASGLPDAAAPEAPRQAA